MMHDCPSAATRDRLPDLVHERLTAEERAAVLAHVAECAECAAELSMLHSVRAALTVRVDVARIAGNVARFTRPEGGSTRAAPRRPRFADWRIAAAIAVLVVGGGWAALTMRGRDRGAAAVAGQSVGVPGSAATEGGAAPLVVAGATTGATATGTAATAGRGDPVMQTAELSLGGGTSDLSDRELESLLDGIESLDAVPTTEPDPVAIRVTAVANRGSSE